MDTERFSFSELERRIDAMPDGPIGMLNRPRWQYWLDVGGGVGMIVGLLPGLFFHLMTPQMWMLTMARIGLWMSIGFFLPGFIRAFWTLALLIRQGKRGDAAQLDHDFAAFSGLQSWLAKFPRQTVEQHSRFVQMAQTRVAAKLSLFGGGLERFGILPLLIAAAVQIKAFTSEGLDIPLWQTLPALFIVITYLIGLNGAFMRLRMQLYEAVLGEALERRPPE